MSRARRPDRSGCAHHADRQRAFDFENDLPPGLRCTISRVLGIKSAPSAEMTVLKRYQFNSCWPFVRRVQPSGGKIDERQLFMLAPYTQSARRQRSHRPAEFSKRGNQSTRSRAVREPALSRQPIASKNDYTVAGARGIVERLTH